MADPRPVALDHNFPETILRSVERFLPELALHWIRDLPGSLNEFEDHDLIYELHRRGFPVMVTNNHKMLDDRRVLVAIELTRVTVVALEGSGDDPVFATGVLLRDLHDVISRNTPQGLYYRIRPSRVSPSRARERLERLGEDWEQVKDQIGRPYHDRTPYPAGHDLRVT